MLLEWASDNNIEIDQTIASELDNVLAKPIIQNNFRQSTLSDRLANYDVVEKDVSLILQTTLPAKVSIAIAEMIANGETIIKFSSVLNDGVYSIMEELIVPKVLDIIDENNCFTEFYDFVTELVKYKNDKGIKSSVGEGERVCIIMDPEYTESVDGKPDLLQITNGKYIEVKGMSSRLESTQGYVSTLVAAEYLYNEVKKITGINFGEKYGLNYFNPNGRGFNNLNSVIRKYKIDRQIIVDLLTNSFLKIYEKYDRELMSSKISSSIDDLGFVCITQFKRNIAWIQFDYYQKLKGFSSIFFFNYDTLSFSKMSNPDNFVDNLVKFKYDLSISLKEAARNKTSQFTVK